jgi:hypothetical protein
MRIFFRLTLAAAFVAFAAATASAQVTETLTINAAVNARATLTLSVGAISFADSDPDTVPDITASDVVTVTAKSRTSQGNAVTLTIQAPDLTEVGGGTIAASQISWAANGDLSGGTLSNAAVTLVSSTNSGQRTGDMTLVLVNSWAYAVGAYSTTVTYTLSAP